MADSLLLQVSKLPEEVRDAAAAIRDQSLRLHGMVANLLDMARLQAGRITLNREWQPLQEIVGAAIKSLGNTLAPRRVVVALAPDLPLLHFDAVLMERVFANLLENAAKYAPPGTPITLRAGVEGDACLIQIDNLGAGFPPDRLERVFELIERGHNESSIAGCAVPWKNQ